MKMIESFEQHTIINEESNVAFTEGLTWTRVTKSKYHDGHDSKPVKTLDDKTPQQSFSLRSICSPYFSINWEANGY